MRRIEMSYLLSAERTDRPNGSALLRNTMMDVLHAVRAHGSISAAARQMGLSYRHVWGQLKEWEAQLGHGLIVWERGQAA
jgi:putative molybdopterin biosynthesis protein